MVTQIARDGPKGRRQTHGLDTSFLCVINGLNSPTDRLEGPSPYPALLFSLNT